MKGKINFLTISLVVVLAMILFIPLPILVFKILYFFDFLLAISIFVMTVITVIRKKTVKFIPYFLLYFSIFTLALNINSARNILIFAKGKIGEFPVIPKVIGELFSFGFVKGMILFVATVLLTFFSFCIRNKIYSENMKASLKFCRGTLIAHILLYIAITLTACFIAHVSNGTAFFESFQLYLPYSTAQTFLFLIPLTVCGVGIVFLKWGER
ncbi:MAG: hypothetical protein IJ530_16110 [Treponema sp.]|uniref:hypothetical protein n=1 Tax=Treponema sp. TaxID=166 RepID=UPI0025D17052|nr:hypothetical protein [Treponema sp.]MBQ8680778.1 hypothetical protein [Treponema sp.]MBQ8681258.1 hypothetical protein [Treponema sp.]